MIQKVIQVGNSLALIIPKELAQKYNFQKGKNVFLEEDEIKQGVLFTQQKPVSTDGLTPEYIAWKKAFIKNNRTLLERLSKFHGKHTLPNT